jgi:acetyl-CoA carboxylase carboxyl transferase subunit beta
MKVEIFVLDHGFLDFIVDRKDLKDKLTSLLGMLK